MQRHDPNNPMCYVRFDKYDGVRYDLPCIVCKEPVGLTKEESDLVKYGRQAELGSKMCDKCKKAILYIREQKCI